MVSRRQGGRLCVRAGSTEVLPPASAPGRRCESPARERPPASRTTQLQSFAATDPRSNKNLGCVFPFAFLDDVSKERELDRDRCAWAGGALQDQVAAHPLNPIDET